MGEVRKVDVALSDALATEIDQAIKGGDYSDLDDVIGDALGLWRAKREAGIARLRQMMQEGLDSGEAVPGNFNPDDIRRRGLERLRREKQV